MTDLAEFDAPISSLFDVNVPESARAPFRLTAAQLSDFERDGFVRGPRVLSEGQLAALRVELSELTRPGHAGQQHWYEYNSNESRDPARVLFHALGAWRLRPGFHDILWNPAVTTPAAQLLGGAVRFWHDQLFCKPALHGGVVAWHQDYSYWTRTTPLAHLTCWIGLDDSTVDNGCVHYIPGSHHWDLLPITGLAGDMTAIRQVLTDSRWEQFQHPVPVELQAGECVFHHGLTIHGSFENSTSAPRRAVVINMVRDGVLSGSDEPLLAGVPAVPSGTPLQGRFFPLLYAPTASES